ncbi:hypothetical protein K458DRAFT_406914 [Lentithecium fluviatile CBS 122367]|uniref:Uncharacterized protein n=1 Tax=Lentithecium fluviatile CBS 122367 TaxID=1168545 RepID=A0A6G1IRL8_9PLEO|nr:hypothetical protein K458DRAFT_406914 [Lentithecium fluviatile CBS 122367]
MVFGTSFSMQTGQVNRSYVGVSLDALWGLNTRIECGHGGIQGALSPASRVKNSETFWNKDKDSWDSLMVAKDPITGQSFTSTDLHREAAIVISVASHPSFSFIPERWLARSTDNAPEEMTNLATQESRKKVNDAYCAFSVGPISFPGKSTAYHHMMVLFAKMVWQFEFKRAPTPRGYENKRMGRAISQAIHDEYPLRDTFSAEADGPWVQFRRRV